MNEWHEKLQKYRTIKAYASKVIKFAMKRGYISNNPFDLVDLPGTKQEKKQSFNNENFYSKEQLNEFLNILENENNFKIYVFFRLLAYSGVRKGEAFALHWGDIDFENNEIVINKAVTRGSTNNLYIKSTKTGIGRILKMDDKTMHLLKEWQSKQRIIFGDLINTNPNNQLVFSNNKNNLVQPTKAQQWIKSVQDKYNLHKITPHGLRHTHCSLLFEAGATLKEVQDRLGHNDVQTTLNIYAHVTKKAQKNAINKFNKFLNED